MIPYFLEGIYKSTSHMSDFYASEISGVLTCNLIYVQFLLWKENRLHKFYIKVSFVSVSVNPAPIYEDA